METIIVTAWIFGVFVAIGAPILLCFLIIRYLLFGINNKELDKEVKKSARYLGKLSSEFSKGRSEGKK